jgi:hypothetical protein
MSYKRKKIRKALLDILRGRTDAREKVFATRTMVNWEENLPVINLYFRGEEVKDTESAPRYLNRSLSLEVEIVADANNDEELADALDDICEQVEVALSRDDSLKDTADDNYLVRVSDADVATEGARAIGKVSLSFIIEYREFAPRDTKGQGVGPLDGIDADYRVGHDDGPPTMDEADAAKDTIDFP